MTAFSFISFAFVPLGAAFRLTGFKGPLPESVYTFAFRMGPAIALVGGVLGAALAASGAP